ncbi:ABC transporter substrate-binding protein [Staphylococcus delphini]|uniref:ABC transporter substrate-binding protein n=1 Tax=Staphylococcus delphini TaxID=53344 RepID=A0A2A4GXN0_9STAP|nr:glycine betaine ABC transporter substrate-binding protein [Staphylococcus delphini]PCF55286.1 ABC transporter substrate-binding protein [Staphylococcus delphini]PCF60863.1 ABC transporter substrate-binding protein [Staphylococcus delphini]PCF72302.1 ABC transporter substrate-binding protein [Staphylococcus delphini]HEC2157926.1 ABC transporter substrate-binding protein [Staphylococcus delphini]
MLKKKSVRWIGMAFILMMTLVLSACGQSQSDSDQQAMEMGGKEIEIPYTSDGSTARSLVIAEVLKEAGYDVITTPVPSSGPMYASVAQNSDAFHASGRFPDVDDSYMQKYGEDLTVYDEAHFIDDAPVGLAVPKYMSIDSIAKLDDEAEMAKEVNHQIQGTDPRNGVMKQTKAVLDDYDLDDWQLKEASDEEMLKALEEKYKKQEPIIITGWQPHWLFDTFEMKMLDDPNHAYGNEKKHVDLVFNKDFKEAHPAAYTIATRIAKDWDDKDEDALMKQIFVDKKNAEQVAQDYVDDHDRKVDDWISGVKDNQ